VSINFVDQANATNHYTTPPLDMHENRTAGLLVFQLFTGILLHSKDMFMKITA